MNRLYRSQYDKKLCGVCGGMANYFHIDSTIVRFLWVLISPAFLIYIVCALLIPIDPNEVYVDHHKIFKSSNRVISGVCGGFADFLHIDPVIVRILWCISIFAYGTGIFAYLIMSWVMPNDYDKY